MIEKDTVFSFYSIFTIFALASFSWTYVINCISCVIQTIVCHWIFACISISAIITVASQSRFPVGSSAKIHCGVVISARIIATFCFSHPLSKDTFVSNFSTKSNSLASNHTRISASCLCISCNSKGRTILS